MSQPPTFLPPPQTQLPPPSTFTQPSSQSGYPQQPQYPSSQPGYGDSYGPRYAQQPYPSGGNNGLSSQQPASSQFQSAVNTNNSYYPPPPPQSSSYQSSSAQQLPPVNNSQYVSSYGQPQQPRDRYYSGQGFELPAPPRGTYLPNPLDTVPSYKGATYSQPSGPYNSNTQAGQYPISSSRPQQHYASIQPRSPPVLSYKTFSSGPPQPGPPNQTYSSQPPPPSNYPTASSSLGYAPQSNSQYQPVSNYPKSSAPYAHFSVPHQLSPPQTQNTLPPPVPSSYGQPSSGGYSSQQPQHQQQKPYNPHPQQEPAREFVIPSNNMPMTVPPPAQPKPQPPQPQFNRVDPASVTDPTRLFPKKRGRPPKSSTADLSQRFNDILERAASNEAIPDMRAPGESLKKKARVDSIRSDGITEGYDSPNGNGQDFNGSMDSLGGFGSPRVGVQRLEGVESNGANQASMPKRVNIGRIWILCFCPLRIHWLY
ncbi:hypothetical protein BCR33DRAFT_114718 [Rhizoclosmatium globosum]|uniref:Uncharacterized protein n=1 Tax=Rhizoclosmatium globosum TaxID=329046 RepID=A0A1Y2CIX8_9FUNG|nr:hypothetical protein BCR33DRAFT_114718 [Rhizoclosmatium globosum]|eukprot:ORY46991.1 hypothetical protein BCR33DRAFT_114718 [Rhizoclosmatium globosum]